MQHNAGHKWTPLRNEKIEKLNFSNSNCQLNLWKRDICLKRRAFLLPHGSYLEDASEQMVTTHCGGSEAIRREPL